MSTRRFMLDTDTVSFVMRDLGNVAERLTTQAPSTVCMSAITLSELRFGADKRHSKKLHDLIDTFTSSVDVLPFDASAATLFGRVAIALQTKGSPIGTFDTLIAAHALSLKCTLVTHNTRHFKQVRGLKLQDWF